MPYFKRDVAEWPRHEFFYFGIGADLLAMRYDAWKVAFKTVKGNLFNRQVETTSASIVTNLRQDPWERYQVESMDFCHGWGEKLWTMVPAVQIVGGFLKSFNEYPPSQASGGLTVTQFLEAV